MNCERSVWEALVQPRSKKVAPPPHTTNHTISRRTAARKLPAFIEQAAFRFGGRNYKRYWAGAMSSLNDRLRVDTDQSTDAENQLR
jgi:hypothetical protein